MSPLALQAFSRVVIWPEDVALAEAELVRRCTREKGFPGVPRTAAYADSLLGLPTAMSVTSASRVGYGGAIARDPRKSVDALATYVDSLPTSERTRFETVLQGGEDHAELTLPDGSHIEAPTQGCQGETRARLYGSVENWMQAFYIPQGANRYLKNLSESRPLAAPRRAFVECMRSRGFRVGNWQDPAAQAAAWYRGHPQAGDRPAPFEQRIAVADAACREESHLVTAYADAAARAAAPWIAEHEVDLLKLSDVMSQARERAVAALADTTTGETDG